MEERYCRFNKGLLTGFFLINLFCFLYNPLVTTTEEVWEGSAARIRKGEIEGSGFFAASNSFPQETEIEVSNLKTGDKVRVLVIKRLDSDVNIFLLLSHEAADALGIGVNEVARVSVRLVFENTTDLVARREYLTYNPDPDVNPSIAYSTSPELSDENTSDTAVTDTDSADHKDPKDPKDPPLELVTVVPPDDKQTDTQQQDSQETDKQKTDEQKTDEQKTDEQKTDTQLTDNRPTDTQSEDTGQTDTHSVDTLDKATNRQDDTRDADIPALTEPRLAQVDTLEYTLRQKAQREPQKNLFRFPREGDVFVSLDAERPQPEKVALDKIDQPETEQPNTEEKATVNKKSLTTDNRQIALNEPDTRRLDQKAVEDLQFKRPHEVEDEAKTIQEPYLEKGKTDTLPDTGRKEPADNNDVINTFDLIPVEGLVEEDVPEVIVTVSEPDDKDSAITTSTREPVSPLVENQEELNEADINALLDKQLIALSHTEPSPKPELTPAPVLTPAPTVTVLPVPSPTPTQVAAPSLTPVPTELPVKADEGKGKLVLEPTGPKPPVETPAPYHTQDDKTALLAASEMNLKADYARGRIYFIQLAAYQEINLAEKLKTAFSSHYPIDVYSATGHSTRSSRIFKVLVGPLNKDESGTILYRFQAMGFKDAFIKTVAQN